MRRLPVATGLQIILWHDIAAERSMRWSHDVAEGGPKVDIARQIRATIAAAQNEDHSDDQHG